VRLLTIDTFLDDGGDGFLYDVQAPEPPSDGQESPPGSFRFRRRDDGGRAFSRLFRQNLVKSLAACLF